MAPADSYRSQLYGVYRSGFKTFTDGGGAHDRWARGTLWRLRGWLPGDKNAPILDVGCGDGSYLKLLRAQGYTDLRGIDISAEQVEAARREFSQVECGDAVAYVESRAATFGAICAFDFLEHLSRDEALRFARAARRALRPGGALILQLPNAAAPRGMHYFAGDLTHEQVYSPGSLEQLLRAAGFTAVEFRETAPAPIGASGLARLAAWKALRGAYQVLDIIETGGQIGIYTRNVMARASG